MSKQHADESSLAMPLEAMISLVVDIWRIRRRIDRTGNTPEPVALASDTAMERLTLLGFRVEDLLGRPYDSGMAVQVVHTNGGESDQRITECVSPAVYFRDRLLKRAEIVVEGEAEDGKADS